MTPSFSRGKFFALVTSPNHVDVSDDPANYTLRRKVREALPTQMFPSISLFFIALKIIQICVLIPFLLHRKLITSLLQISTGYLVIWDLWWDKVALGQVFSEYFGFPCYRLSLHQLFHNHPHVSSGECTIGQCGRSARTYRDLGDLKQRDLRNLNLGDLKMGPKGA
jgi:hypothetical protein